MKWYFTLNILLILSFSACQTREIESLRCFNSKEDFKICIPVGWPYVDKSDYFLISKLKGSDDFFAVNVFDNGIGDQMFYDYLTGSHETFFDPNKRLTDYSIHEFVDNGFRYLYSIYDYEQQNQRVRFISVTFNSNQKFYDISIRFDLENEPESEELFRKVIIPSIQLRGKSQFDPNRLPKEINEITVDPLDSLLRVK